MLFTVIIESVEWDPRGSSVSNQTAQQWTVPYVDTLLF